MPTSSKNPSYFLLFGRGLGLHQKLEHLAVEGVELGVLRRDDATRRGARYREGRARLEEGLFGMEYCSTSIEGQKDFHMIKCTTERRAYRLYLLQQGRRRTANKWSSRCTR